MRKSDQFEYYDGFLGPQRECDKGKKTLLLDLDETLIHSELNSEFNPNYKFDITINVNGDIFQFFVNVRKGAKKFIQEMSKYYEVVTFTASLKQYSDKIVDYLDPKGLVAYRLSRGHCLKLETGKGYIKDLSLIGRDLKNVILIDNTPQCFILQPENGIQIINFYDDMSDRELPCMQPFLKFLSLVNDVRPVTEYILNYLKNPLIEYIDINGKKQTYVKASERNMTKKSSEPSSPRSEDLLLMNEIKKSEQSDSNDIVQVQAKEMNIQISELGDDNEPPQNLQTITQNQNQKSYSDMKKFILVDNLIYQLFITLIQLSSHGHQNQDTSSHNFSNALKTSQNKEQFSSVPSQAPNQSSFQYSTGNQQIQKSQQSQNQSSFQYSSPQSEKSQKSYKSQISDKYIQNNQNFLKTTQIQNSSTKVLDQIPTDRSEGSSEEEQQSPQNDISSFHNDGQNNNQIKEKFIDLNQNNSSQPQQLQNQKDKYKKPKSYLKIEDVNVPKYRSIILGDSHISLSDKKQIQQYKSQVMQASNGQQITQDSNGNKIRQSFVSFSTETVKSNN